MKRKSQGDSSKITKDNISSKTISSSSSRSSRADDRTLENVLILQGGEYLGAFGCGVFKALANNNIKLDMIAGTSIGGINAPIIAGSKEEKHPEEALEQFWLELSESFVDLHTAPSSFSTQVCRRDAIAVWLLLQFSNRPIRTKKLFFFNNEYR